MEKIFVFSGSNSLFPGGVFSDLDIAKSWIKRYGLNGILNAYPINVGLYDYAIDNNYFEVKNENHTRSSFIEKFTCASIEHYHFENGSLV